MRVIRKVLIIFLRISIKSNFFFNIFTYDFFMRVIGLS